MSPTNNSPVLDQESELTLAICSDDPDAVASQVASIRELAGCRVIPDEGIDLRDRYFDTPRFAILDAKWALRLRHAQGNLFVALKGPVSHTEWGGLARPEIEGKWSLETFLRIMQVLAGLGLTGVDPTQVWSPDAFQTITSLGFRVIQDRWTRREVRDVKFGTGPDGDSVAELVIDRVVYDFPGMEIVHFEVEIEAKAAASAHLLGAMKQELLGRFGSSLCSWDHNKLAIGFALGRLLDLGELSGLVNISNRLGPGAYDRMTALFASGWRIVSDPPGNRHD
jgi:hypothetical protein